MTTELAPRDQWELDALGADWDPWSSPESLWHACPGHQWERFEWDRNRGRGEPLVERITRCERCGAPRCDVYDFPNHLPYAARQGDAREQRFRCTAERHHRGDHDFLHLPAAVA